MRLRRRGDSEQRQRLLPFRERAERRDRQAKRIILAATILVLAALLGGTATGRYAVGSLVGRARLGLQRLVGLEPSRGEVEAQRQRERDRTERLTRESLERYYRGADPPMQRLFQAAGMDPEHAVIGSGRPDNAFLLSSAVFAKDDHGRSYRLRPRIRSVWLRQVTLREGPFALFLVPDTAEVREAAGKVGAIIEEPSAQTTNSWGLRGPEPDPNAPARGIVLGDSFMQGTFIGDAETAPLRLQEELARIWKRPVSVLNTGHLGYAPEQYYRTLLEYGPRFRPRFVVVSVCPNDFGNEYDVIAGRGDDWGDAAYWLAEIVQWCRTNQAICLLVPVPGENQMATWRADGHYPAPASNRFRSPPAWYCNPLDEFVDEHLRLRLRDPGRYGSHSPLYNGRIDDGHFSPDGAALWGRVVARRIALLLPARGDRKAR